MLYCNISNSIVIEDAGIGLDVRLALDRLALAIRSESGAWLSADMLHVLLFQH